MGCIGAANATVYQFNQTIGAGSVTGNITTDGTVETLAAHNITAWNLTLTGLPVGPQGDFATASLH